MEQDQVDALYDKHAAESTDDKVEEPTDDVQADGDDNDSTDSTDAEAVADDAGDDNADDAEDDGTDDADDDADDTEDEPEDEQKDAVELPPREQFIYENLHAITVKGTVDGKPKELSIRLAQELPDNFEFGSKREEKMFDQALAEQAVLADRLNGKWQTDQTAHKAQAQQVEQAKSIRADIESLQKEGLLPKFDKAKADTDPKAVATREVLKLYNEYRDKGSQISFRDAFEINEAKKIRSGNKTKTDTVAAKRKEVSAKVGNARGDAKEATESRWKPGMRVDDVTTAYEGEWSE